jgi:hypothetical protein
MAILWDFIFFSPKNILSRIRTAFDAKWQNFIPRKNLWSLVKCSVREWLSSALSNLILCRNEKQISNNTHFYAGTVIFSPVRFYSMPEWSPSPLLKNNYMPDGHLSPLSDFKSFRISWTFSHFWFNWVKNYRPEWLSSPSILCRIDHLLPYQIQFYDWNVIFVRCQSSRLSLSHILHLSDIPRPID